MQNNSSKLALLSLIINAFLAMAVIILFVRNPKATDSNVIVPDNVDTLNYDNLNQMGTPGIIAYYNADSMNAKCNLLIDLQSDLTAAAKEAEIKIQKKQNAMKSWDEKWQKRVPLTSTEQEQYMKEGEKLQIELMELQQTLEQELYAQQSQSTMLAVTRVSNYCRDLALANGYDFVMSYQLGGQIMFANPKMDITNVLIETINADYAESSSDSSAVEETTP